MPPKTRERVAPLRHFHGTEEHEHPYRGVHNHPSQHLPSHLSEETISQIRSVQSVIRKLETRWPAVTSTVWKVYDLFSTSRSPQQVAREVQVAEQTIWQILTGLSDLGLITRMPDGTFKHSPNAPPALLTYARRRMAGAPPLLRGFQSSGQTARTAGSSSSGGSSQSTSGQAGSSASGQAGSSGTGKTNLPVPVSTGTAGRAKAAAEPKRSRSKTRKKPKKARSDRARTTVVSPQPQRRRVRPARVARTMLIVALIAGLGAGGFVVVDGLRQGISPVEALTARIDSGPEEPPATRAEAEERFVEYVRGEARSLRSVEASTIVHYGNSICERLDEGAPRDRLREASIEAGRPAQEYDPMFEGVLRYLCPQHDEP